MRSDPAGRAGGSAAATWTAAGRNARRRRVVQALALAAGAAGAVLAPAWGWRAAAIAVAVAAAGLLEPDPDPGRWRRGAVGEQATAALLARLPQRRWVVFHDRALPGSAANLDHVAIGPTGVWMIDTKTYRAPLRAGWRSVRAGDRLVDTRPAAWEASVVADRLGTEVRAVVAVHGTGLAARGRRVGGVRVIPAAALVRWLRRRRGSARLGRREVAALGAEFDRVFTPAWPGSGGRAGGHRTVPARPRS